MDPVSALLINRSLDGLSMRYMATAHNIANANSPGFRPLKVTFEESLRAAALQGPDAVRRVTPRLEHTAVPKIASEMRLDLELASASETAMRYSALVDLLGRQMEITRTAIRGGQ